jgi:hypothetical protein
VDDLQLDARRAARHERDCGLLGVVDDHIGTTHSLDGTVERCHEAGVLVEHPTRGADWPHEQLGHPAVTGQLPS